MINLKVNNKPVDFVTSKFPDGTRQIWQLNSEVDPWDTAKIDFIWANDQAEIFDLFMLIDLLRNKNPEFYIHLNIPYLCFSRQDKDITNKSTFALHSFANLLNSKKLNLITSFDVHSKVAQKLIKNFVNIKPDDFHLTIYNKFKPDHIFYPDEGAAKRYSRAINQIQLYGEKVRNQLTGNIEGYRIVNSSFHDLKGKRVLIVDDIIDAGATFVAAAKSLKELEVGEIGLCTSHALYSKGKEPLIEAGISCFFTTNSLKSNEGEYKVYE